MLTADLNVKNLKEKENYFTENFINKMDTKSLKRKRELKFITFYFCDKVFNHTF